MKCGTCNIAKHLWAFPFDSWSMIQLHLFRERRNYTSKSADIPVLSDIDWTSNRLRVLEALQALNAVATALAKSPDFREKCKWTFMTAHIDFPHIQNSNRKGRLSTRKLKGKDPKGKARVKKPIQPKSEMIGYTDRVKLAGIHRAQPWSHLFEHGKFHDCTLAPWADLVHKDQVAAYIRLRDRKADEMEDIPKPGRTREPRPEFRHREPPEREADQGGDGSQFDRTQDDSSDSASTIEADAADAYSTSSGGSSDLDADYDTDTALFDDFGVGDYGSDDSNYATDMDGIDDVYDGMDNPDYPGNDSMDTGYCNGGCDCVVYSDGPAYTYNSLPRSPRPGTPQDQGRADRDATSSSDDGLGAGDELAIGVAASLEVAALEDDLDDSSVNDEYSDNGDDSNADPPPYDGGDDDPSDDYDPGDGYDPSDDYAAADTSVNFDLDLDNSYVDEYYLVDDGNFVDTGYEFSPPETSYELGLDSNFDYSSFDTGYSPDLDFSSTYDSFDSSFGGV